MPQIIIAGPNGVGKTSFANKQFERGKEPVPQPLLATLVSRTLAP